jgi:two-component system chemotaxis sensor kinase CheA
MATDPYRYFRVEAHELLEGLSQGVLELEKDGVGTERIGHLLRLAHTLKGAARVVKQPRIAELAHAVEGVLAPHREAPGPVGLECVNEVLRMLDAIAAEIASLDRAVEGGGEGRPPPATDEPLERIHVEIGEMDDLHEEVSEASVQLTALRRENGAVERTRQVALLLLDHLRPSRGTELDGTAGVASIGRARALAEELRGALDGVGRNLATGIDHLEGALAQVRNTANRLRLLPTSAVFTSLERAARDAAQSLQKRVEFQTSGGETRLDAHVLAALRSALLHAVRNAVAHGIEAESERVAAGKSAVGRVELHVERRGNRIMFTCRDDGRGIDVEAVRRAAARRGLLSASEAEALSVDRAVQLILQGGVTTTRAVTEVSGRGIGLDVVRETAARLKGEVSVVSEPGRGTTIEIRVPVSVSSLTALVVSGLGISASIPLDAVRRTLRVADSEIARSGESDSILCDGEVIPFLPLARALGRQMAPGRDHRPWSVVVVQSGAGLAAIGVDRVLGTATVVVRALPPVADADPLVAGASLDAAGDPQLVLDPGSLVAVARAGRGLPADSAVMSRPSVLVVDDSLTTRMLEQSILESAGYEVDLATSAEEALNKARDQCYRLFVVDVEMPGMDGFEFVARTRADPGLRETPAILVTSRSSAEDRRRGEQVGARAYIVKSEFDQAYLLQTIRELVG